ncbi:ATP-dependent RNA helicase DDX51 [Palaemon carinicauda]|uniref:ATP-dependent RNA helicase DDX51 n=1 Tax=Palaemon carinicauda TaxID=392227 RepID=UPI0035B5F5EE
MVKLSLDVSAETMNEDHIPKKKKKKHSDKTLEGSDPLNVGEHSNDISNVSLQDGEESSVTPLKKKKSKRHSYDSCDASNSGVRENGANGDADVSACETPHKKKKKKRKHDTSADEIHVESEQKEENNLTVEDGCRSFNKKKKKRKDNDYFEQDIPKMEEIASPEKKKSKASKSKLNPEVGTLDVVDTTEPHPEEEPIRKKKKKKKQSDKSFQESSVDVDEGKGNVLSINSQGDVGNSIPLKSKKKKRSHDVNDLKDIANSLDNQESEVKQKTKKKKHSLDANALLDGTSTDAKEKDGKQKLEVQNAEDSTVAEGSCDTSEKKKKKKKNKDKNLKETTEQTQIDDVKEVQTFTFNFFGNGNCFNDEEEKESPGELQVESKQEVKNYSMNFLDTRKNSPRKKKRKDSESLEQEIPKTDRYTHSMKPDWDRKIQEREEEQQLPDKKKKKDRVSFEQEIPTTERDTLNMKSDLNEKMQEREEDQQMSDIEEGIPENVDESAPSEEEDGDGRSRTVGGFTIIDQVPEIRKTKVDRVLPEWLSNPTTVSLNLGEGIPVNDIVGLDPFITKCLHRENIEKFFPIQAAVIPELLSSANPVSMRFRPRDVCVAAPTGSGKTLAYVLPIVQALRKRVVPKLRALILLPTQELAVQVHNVIEKFVRFTNLKLCLAVGSHSFTKEQKTLVFQDSSGICAADILIATPGRLADHINSTEGLSFEHLRFLVVDEADLFLSSSGGDMMLKIEQLKKHIHRPLPDNSLICGGFCTKDSLCLPEFYIQQVLVSATLMHDPEQLKVLDLHRPKLFIARKEDETNIGTVVPYLRPEELREEYVIVDSSLKPLVLYHLIHTHKLRRVLVFTKSTMATKTLSIFLSAMSKNYKIAHISSKESNRKELVSQFSRGKIDVLISSDIMARGLDLTRINQVVSYDVPSLQNYVHRIGRTGRAGKQGFALSLVENTAEVKNDFKSILRSCEGRLHKIQVTERELSRYDSQYKAALATLKETLSKEKKTLRSHKLKAKLVRIKKPKKKREDDEIEN